MVAGGVGRNYKICGLFKKFIIIQEIVNKFDLFRNNI